ncbi:MAG TPA: ABC transporter ATP-binding protein [Anaerolineaceae bacterium]|jgi:ATP-binding cassette subfamily B multidrug efflux pump|nr:ABC transporter ATP-binding protein [Anaerolineaceae bacterium]
MATISKILKFVKPYWKLALLSMLMLLLMVLSDLAIPRLIATIIDDGIRQNRMDVMWHTSLMMVGIAVINTVAAVLNNIFSVRVGEKVARDMREALFLNIQQFSYGDLDRFSTGKLMVRLTSDIAAVQLMVRVSLRIGARAPLLMIGSIILMFLTSARLATAIIPILIITSAIIILFSIKMEPLFRAVQQKLDHLNTVLQENIAGARLVKAFVRADHESQRFGEVNEDLTLGTVRVMQFMSSMSPALTIFVNIGMILVIWYGGLQTIQGELQIGQVVAFTNYLLTTMTPLILMANLSNTWANGLASAKRINQILDVEPEITFPTQEAQIPQGWSNAVEFSEVSFHYNGNNNLEVLEGINLRARPAQIVAVLGATGSGKSSLVNLIPRFYDPSRGEVRIGDLNIKVLKEATLLSQIGIVPQESILFSGTVGENISYGKACATDEEIEMAAKVAQAHDFIMSFPKGYASYIEERGANLSGGQKQRIAIARAIITRPRILILDDATSSVDVETETKIQDGLREYVQGSTIFMVAQRISTVLNADRIIVLDKGRLVAQGSHAALMKKSRIYREIYESQLGNGLASYEKEALQ